MAYIPQAPAIAKTIADKYAATAEYLQKRHDATVAAASELKANIAALPLNEAEEEWRNNIVNAIDERLNNIDIGGFVGYGFNDIVKATGDIASSPAMIGRLQAQKDYTNFQNEIKSRQDLTELEKEYFLTKNPYYYQDKVNDKGQIVNGTKWQPIERALTKVDFTKVLDKAKEWAVADSNSSTTIHFVDENGEETTDLSRIKDAYYFNTITSENVYLSKDKIRQAIKSAVVNTPGAAESITQDYKIAVWAAENKGINDGVIGEDGLPISPEEYFALKTDSFVDHTSYRHTKYSNKIEETDLAKQRAKASEVNTKNNFGYEDISEPFYSPSAQTSRGGAIEQSTDEFKKSQEQGAKAKLLLEELIGNDIKLNYNLSDEDFKNSIAQLLADGNLTEDEYIEAMAYTNQIISAKHRKDFVYSNGTEKEKERYNFIELYNNGLPVDESAGDIGKRYNNLLKRVWKSPSEEDVTHIGYVLNNKMYNNFINRIGGEEKFKSLGGIIEDFNGIKTIKLPYNYKENTGLIAMALRATENGIPLHKYSNNIDLTEKYYKTDTMISREDDEALIRFISKQQRKVDKYINNNPVFATTTVLDGASIEELNYKNKAKIDIDNATTYLKLADEEHKTAVHNLLNGDYNQYNIKVWDGKYYVDADGDQITNLNRLVNSAKFDEDKTNKRYKVELGFIQDELGNISRIINILDEKSDKGYAKSYKYLESMDGSSRDAIKLANDSNTLATKSLGELNLYNEPIRLAGLPNATITLYDRYDNHQDNIYSINYNGKDIGTLNREDAFDLTRNSIELKEMIRYTNGGINIDPNKYASLARTVANTYAKYGLVNGNSFFIELLEQAGFKIEEQ